MIRKLTDEEVSLLLSTAEKASGKKATGIYLNALLEFSSRDYIIEETEEEGYYNIRSLFFVHEKDNLNQITGNIIDRKHVGSEEVASALLEGATYKSTRIKRAAGGEYESVLVEYTPSIGPHKEGRVARWLPYGDPEIKALLKKNKGKIINKIFPEK